MVFIMNMDDLEMKGLEKFLVSGGVLYSTSRLSLQLKCSNLKAGRQRRRFNLMRMEQANEGPLLQKGQQPRVEQEETGQGSVFLL